MASAAKVGEGEDAVETQQHSFTEEELSQMHEKVRELARQYFTDKEELESVLGRLDSGLQTTSGLQERGSHLQGALKELQEGVEKAVSQLHEKVRELAQQWYTDKEELAGWSGKLDSELQEMSGLQERGNRLQGAMKMLQEDLRARSVEPAAEQVEAQQQPFTAEDVSQMHEEVRELAQQKFADKENELDKEELHKEELEGWLDELDSELQEISDLQERGNYLQWALKKLEAEVEYRRCRSKGPAAEQVEVLKLLRGAREVLRARWPEDKPPNEWGGVTFNQEGQVTSSTSSTASSSRCLAGWAVFAHSPRSNSTTQASRRCLPRWAGCSRSHRSTSPTQNSRRCLPRWAGCARSPRSTSPAQASSCCLPRWAGCSSSPRSTS